MKYYKRFADCFLVSGYCRSAIYDITRKDVLAIDKTTYELLSHEIITSKLLKTLSQETIQELILKGIIFPIHITDAHLFPSIKTEFINPFYIVSCILDIDHFVNYNIYDAIKQINTLSCLTLQVRISTPIQSCLIDEVLSYLVDKNIRSVELIMPFSDNILELTNKYKTLTSITLHSAPKYGFNQINGCSIISTMEQYLNVEQCGIIEPNYFVCNRNMYLESLNYNSCLNKKISINALGEIKNCPSCSKSYGNIRDINLKQVLENLDFKKLWGITKDQIDVCKDCELRHMCTDCRAYINDPENIYSQPAKCTYNPYIAKWQGEEGYVPVEQCGTYARETGFIVDKEKVEALNLELWG